MERIGLVQLNLRTKKAPVLLRNSEHKKALVLVQLNLEGR
jgi:hypothetical protein